MHVFHTADTTKNGIISSAIGIIFDSNDYDKSITQDQIVIIDKFFDSFMLNLQTESNTREIPFGELMAIIDTNNRWVYKGSLTTPPCSKTVYFNIL